MKVDSRLEDGTQSLPHRGHCATFQYKIQHSQPGIMRLVVWLIDLVSPRPIVLEKDCAVICDVLLVD